MTRSARFPWRTRHHSPNKVVYSPIRTRALPSLFVKPPAHTKSPSCVSQARAKKKGRHSRHRERTNDENTHRVPHLRALCSLPPSISNAEPSPDKIYPVPFYFSNHHRDTTTIAASMAAFSGNNITRTISWERFLRKSSKGFSDRCHHHYHHHCCHKKKWQHDLSRIFPEKTLSRGLFLRIFQGEGSNETLQGGGGLSDHHHHHHRLRQKRWRKFPGTFLKNASEGAVNPFRIASRCSGTKSLEIEWDHDSSE